MKYGQTFQAQSVPEWAPYNIDYNELKQLIKAHTTRVQGSAIAIPGQADASLRIFEDLFFNELSNQHDRVDLFVRSKSDEISRRLQYLQKAVLRLLARCAVNTSKPMSMRRRDRFMKYDVQVERCGDDIRSLQRFVAAQCMAFHKILKKYKKWTGSPTLGERFVDEIFGDHKSFSRRDFEPLLSQYNDLLTNLRASTPDASGPATPVSSRRGSRRPSTQAAILVPQQQAYWNEYDDGSEGEAAEPYAIYINPDAGAFPGSKAFAYIFSGAKKPMEKVKEWLSPSSTPGERRPLLGEGNNSYFNEHQSMIDTDIDDDTDCPGPDYPAGYAAHYATFPSVSDQRLSRNREQLLFHGMLGCFAASVVLLLIAGILVATGKKKFRSEVDAGAIVGVLSSLLFNMFGIGAMLYRQGNSSWVSRICVAITFTAICILNGMLLVYVGGAVVP